MASEIKVDTISEKTSANGITIDGVNIKDSAIATAGSVPLTAIDIDGGTDIGAAIVDADLFIIDDGAGGTNRKTTASRLKTYIGGSDPSSADGDSLGTASAEWSDLYLADGGIIYFGNDQDVTLTHDPDDGLFLKSIATADNNPVLLTLQTGETDMAADDVIGKIAFQAPDEGTGTDAILVSAAIQAVAEGDHSSSSNATRLEFMTGASEAAATKMWLTSGGKLGLGTAPDLGTLHVRTADSGAPVHADQDELVIENSAHAGLTINSGASSKGSIAFSDSGGVSGVVKYDHSTDDLIFHTEDAENLRISGGKLSTGAEASPDVDDGGICIDHNANDGSALTFKNSDVGHGMTGVEEADTYGYIRKYQGNHGGLAVVGFSDSDGGAVDINGYQDGAANNGESTGVNGIIHLNGSIRDGTGVQADGADNNILCVRNGGNTKFIVKGDGELWSDQTATVGTYDTYEDAQLIRAYDLSHMRGVIDSKFDKFVQYKQKDLLDAKLIGKDNEGNTTSFVNWTGMSRLHNGAIWQQYEKHQQLLEAVYDLAKEAVGEEKANSILEKHEVKRLQ